MKCLYCKQELQADGLGQCVCCGAPAMETIIYYEEIRRRIEDQCRLARIIAITTWLKAAINK
ncbi:MAG: hypothetical protein AMS21_01155 [Gemmatimonas sp. SG8_38_2]|nr:MAG: hypothetical protein AMS21_01155 [Gemmatimonas sp. SG8_38_2]